MGFTWWLLFLDEILTFDNINMKTIIILDKLTKKTTQIIRIHKTKV